jgi:thiol:disulfide interchange protein DsbC
VWRRSLRRGNLCVSFTERDQMRPNPSLSLLAIAIAGALLCGAATADDAAPAAFPAGAYSGREPGGDLSAPTIARFHHLADRLNAVETDTGELLFLSGNGRYVIRGQIADLWHAKLVDSFGELIDLQGRLDLARMKVDPAELGALSVGVGPERVVAFIDPRCPHCKDMLAQLDDWALREKYRFDLVLLPILGRESEEESLRIACAAERDEDAALQALLGGTAQDLPKPESGSTCGQESLTRALITAQLLGIGGAPFLIGPDGRVSRGAPASLGAWLDDPQAQNNRTQEEE